MRTSALTLPGDTRRRVPYRSQAGGCSLKVPIHQSNPEGEVIEGRFMVSARLAKTQPHTNQRLEFEGIVQQNFHRWTEWRRLRGYEYVTGTLAISKPYQKLTASVVAEADDELYEVRMLARFRRLEPVYVGLDDFLETQRTAEVFGITPEADPKPWNDVSGTEDTGWVDPMTEAEAERTEMGIKRSEYIVPKWWEEPNG